jgi:cyanophycinase
VATKTLALLGSGEFMPDIESVDKALLKITGQKKPKVAILPTAAGKEHDYDKWIHMGTKHFEKLGAEPLGLHVTNHNEANMADHVEAVNKADLIYFSGGDPGYLYDVLKDSLLWKTVLKKYRSGTVLAGSSAGAMVMGNWGLLNVYETFTTGVMPAWSQSFGLINCGVVPHYDDMMINYADLAQQVMDATPKNVDWVGIDEDTALIIKGDNQTVMGAGKIHLKHPKQKIKLL